MAWYQTFPAVFCSLPLLAPSFGGSRKKTPVGAGSDTAWHLGNDSDE